MSLGRTWYTLGEASSKFCLDTSLILKLADEDLVRAVHTDTSTMQVNVDDIELKLHEVTE